VFITNCLTFVLPEAELTSSSSCSTEWCFADHFCSFCFWSLYCLYGLWLLLW